MGVSKYFMKTWAKVTLGILGFLIIVGILNSIFSPSETTYETGGVVDQGGQEVSEPETKSLEPLTILSHEMVYGKYGNLMIVGVAENTGNKQLSYVEIDVKFYDEEGALIDTSFTNINDIDAGEKWKFEVMYFGLDNYKVDNYKIAVGTVW